MASGEDTKETKTEGAPVNRRRAGLLITMAALVLLVGGIAFWRYSAVRVATDDAQIDGHIMPLAARVSGTVQEVHAQDNQLVSAGTVLVQIDPTDYKVALARAEAELAAASAGAQGARTSVPMTSTTATGEVETADSDVATAAARVRMAQARVKETEAKATKAAQDLERLKTLVAKDEVSRQEYDAAVSAAAAARAEHEGAVAQEREAEAGVHGAQAKRTQAGTASEQVAISRSRAAGAEAQVAQARNFKEGELRDIRPGQPVTIKVDAYGRDYKGRVDSIAAATGARFSLLPPENATGNFVKVVQRIPVKITIDRGQDPDHLLRPGMSVVPTVHTK